MRPDEVPKLLEKLADLPEPSRKRSLRAMNMRLRLFCEVPGQTGLKRNELLTLQIDQTDFERNLLISRKPEAESAGRCRNYGMHGGRGGQVTTVHGPLPRKQRRLGGVRRKRADEN